MARRVKTVSPKQRQRAAGYPEYRAQIDLCRIRTDRLRALSNKQLNKVVARIGPIHMLPKKDRTGFRRMLSKFASDLVSFRRTPMVEDSKANEAYKRAYGAFPSVTNAEIKAMYAREVERGEKQIWQEQAKAGCKIPGHELVARDIEYEGKPGATEAARKLRQEARRPPTPHRRPAKIR